MTAGSPEKPSASLRKARGAAAETMAVAYLELRGYRILARNWRDGPREIDIVVEVGRLVAFIEVKFRATDRFGGARLALRPQQRLDLERAAVAFLKSAGRSDRSVRFDLIGIEFEGDDGLSLAHLKGAYGASRRFYL